MAFDIFDDIIGAPLSAVGLEPSNLPIVGGLFTDPAEEEAQRKLQEMSAEYERLRPIYAQAQEQALRQQLGAMQPTNQMLGQMMGLPGQAMDLKALGRPTLPSEAFGAPEAQPAQGGAAPGSGILKGAMGIFG